MSRAPTVLSSWTQVIVDALDAHGHDSAALLARAGLDGRSLTAPSARCSLSATRAMWHAALEAFDDPACGLMLSRYVRPTTFQALGYAVAASVTLREALRLLLTYSRVVSDANEFRLEASPDHIRLVILPYTEPPEIARSGARIRPLGFETVDALMSLILRTCRWLAGRNMSPLYIEQRRPEPRDRQPYEQFFRCPLHFAQAEDALTFDAAWLDRRLPGGIASLSRHNEELLRKHLADVDAGDLRDRVREVLESTPPGQSNPAHVARSLNVSERTLQRHLSQAGTSFGALLTETRLELACGYLVETQLSVEEIALTLGFTSASSLARAFRRWKNLSPTAFRQAAPTATLQGTLLPPPKLRSIAPQLAR